MEEKEKEMIPVCNDRYHTSSTNDAAFSHVLLSE